MKEIIRLTIFGIGLIIIFGSTTFGWKFLNKPALDLKPKDSLLADRLKTHVYKLSREIGNRDVLNYKNLTQTADYIAEKLKDLKYEVKFQEYTIQGKKVKNIIATKKGSRYPQEIVIIAAHYDSCFNPGADDNASGVAGLLESARFMVDKDNDRTVKFIAFVNEEPPYFMTEDMGSRVYAREAKSRNEDIKAAIILESIGYYTNKTNSQRYPLFFGIFHPPKGNFIGVVANFQSGYLAKEVTADFKNYSKFPIESTITFGFLPGINFGDHWSFWKEGYRAVMITDTAYLRNQNYHKNSDVWDTLNYASMALVIEGFCPVLVGLANNILS